MNPTNSPALLLLALVGCNIPLTGEGMSVTLLPCVLPEFHLDSNYCAEQFVVSDDNGEVWRVVLDEQSVCLTDLSSPQGMTYGADIPGASAPGELVDQMTYTFEASFDSHIEIPDSWSGSFTYECPGGR